MLQKGPVCLYNKKNIYEIGKACKGIYTYPHLQNTFHQALSGIICELRLVLLDVNGRFKNLEHAQQRAAKLIANLRDLNSMQGLLLHLGLYPHHQ